jgi:hypothetical protein
MDEAVLSVIKKQMDVFIDMQKALERLLSMKKAKLRNSGNSQELAALRQKLANKQSVFSGTYLELKEACSLKKSSRIPGRFFPLKWLRWNSA